jgi:3D (Asp-Asp-Asp) domain-containing protein
VVPRARSWYVLPSVAGGIGRLWPLRAAGTVGVVVAAVLLAVEGAGTAPAPGSSAATLSAAATSLADRERRALLDLYAAASALERARVEQEQLSLRSAELARAEDAAQRQSAIVRRAYATSQRRIAALLRARYVQGEPDALAIFLGASSLDDVLDAIDVMRRTTRQNASLARQARARAVALRSVQARLARQRAALATAQDAASVAVIRLEGARDDRARTVASLRRQGDITAARLAALQTQAQAAREQSKAVNTSPPPASPPTTSTAASAETAPPEPAPAPAPASGTRTLVVDAVAYHLPGRTASGLPVGVGVIAVDPTVIPLGTKVFVPGYGPAVAADVGTAIKGNIIDLWMPSTPQARAWGRRTVTMTIYG